MSSKIKIFVSALFAVSLLFGSVRPTPAQVESLPPTISEVRPDTVYNDIPNTIEVIGTHFAASAQVKIGGSDMSTSEALVTNYMGDTSLLANLPVAYAPGVYTIYVINDIANPSTSSASLPAGLTVKLPGLSTRPQISVGSYSTNANSGIIYGQDFQLTVRLANNGGSRARGLQITFVAPELLMLGNGGVISKDGLDQGRAVDIAQNMTAATYFYGQTTTAVDMTVSYFDEKGTQYSDKFTLNLKVYDTYNDVPRATATPTGSHFSQLIISSYKTDIILLQPGMQFKLDMTINNMGDLPAKGVTMIVGGGTSSGGGSGTPGPGGVSGSSGDFSNFAPVGTSNVKPLGDISAQSSLVASQQLIVNVNTNPGAYPMKVTLTYNDSKGNPVNDEQVITLLVYSLPNVDIGFYQPVSDMFTYQANVLPLQVINMGRKSAILGNMTVTSPSGMVENSQAFVGTLEPGGYFTLDAMLTPGMAGQAEVQVTINYTDDFNTSRTISKTLTVNVVEMQVEPGADGNSSGNGGEVPVMQTETFWQKIVRFFLGLFGLDSSSTSGNQSIPVEPTKPLIVPVNPGGKG